MAALVNAGRYESGEAEGRNSGFMKNSSAVKSSSKVADFRSRSLVEFTQAGQSCLDAFEAQWVLDNLSREVLLANVAGERWVLITADR